MKNKNTRGFKLSLYQDLSKTDWANPRILKNDDTWIEITEVSEEPGHNFPILMSDGIRYSVNGKNTEGNNLKIVYDLYPPIIDGRIVSDITFATRFKNFLDEVVVNDLGSEEELEYLKIVAKELLDWQKATVTKPEEIKYFKNLGIEV